MNFIQAEPGRASALWPSSHSSKLQDQWETLSENRTRRVFGGDIWPLTYIGVYISIHSQSHVHNRHTHMHARTPVAKKQTHSGTSPLFITDPESITSCHFWRCRWLGPVSSSSVLWNLSPLSGLQSFVIRTVTVGRGVFILRREHWKWKPKPSRKRCLCNVPRKPNCGLVVLCSGEEGAVCFGVVRFLFVILRPTYLLHDRASSGWKQLQLLSTHSTLALLSSFVFLSFSLLSLILFSSLQTIS